MSDQLYQLNITYSGKEDRLLLRSSTRHGDEYRIWLTRRFSLILLDILDKEMKKYGGPLSVAAKPETTEMIKQGALEQAYEQEKNFNYPLGEEGKLAWGIKSGILEEGLFYLELHFDNDQQLSFNLSKSLLYMLHSLISQGIESANWNIAMIGDTQGPTRVH